MRYVQSKLTHLGAGLLALALFLGGVRPAAAQIRFTGDENGNGTFQGVPDNGFVGQDNGPGGRSNALSYPLGTVPVLAGDVFVHDTTGALTDLIRFNVLGVGNSQLVFYSQPTGSDLADVLFPTMNYQTTAPALEDTAGLITYTPTTGQPGFAGQLAVTYVLTSPDPGGAPIPEPSTLSILAAGLGLAAWWRRRRAVATA
jgi:hypothetical protein